MLSPAPASPAARGGLAGDILQEEQLKEWKRHLEAIGGEEPLPAQRGIPTA